MGMFGAMGGAMGGMTRPMVGGGGGNARPQQGGSMGAMFGQNSGMGGGTQAPKPGMPYGGGMAPQGRFGQQMGQLQGQMGGIFGNKPMPQMGGGMGGSLINRLPQRGGMGQGMPGGVWNPQGIEQRRQQQEQNMKQNPQDYMMGGRYGPQPIYGRGSPAHKRILAGGGNDIYAQMDRIRSGQEDPWGRTGDQMSYTPPQDMGSQGDDIGGPQMQPQVQGPGGESPNQAQPFDPFGMQRRGPMQGGGLGPRMGGDFQNMMRMYGGGG